MVLNQHCSATADCTPALPIAGGLGRREGNGGPALPPAAPVPGPRTRPPGAATSQDGRHFACALVCAHRTFAKGGSILSRFQNRLAHTGEVPALLPQPAPHHRSPPMHTTAEATARAVSSPPFPFPLLLSLTLLDAGRADGQACVAVLGVARALRQVRQQRTKKRPGCSCLSHSALRQQRTKGTAGLFLL